MRRIWLIIIATYLWLPTAAQTEADNDTLGAAPAQPLPYPQYIQHRLDSIIANAPLLQVSQLGLMVYDLDADSTIYAYNHRQTMRPASTMKLLTAITAIDRLSDDYRLYTSLYYTGQIVNRVLRGDLICVGGMDPAFNAEDMAAFASSLRQLAVDTVKGRIVADRSFKEADLLGEGWCWDDDNPQLSPLLIGKNDNFVERLAAALAAEGIVLVDSLLPAAPGKTLVCHRTHNLDQILWPMLKDSNNLYAEAVYYQLAASGGNRPAKASHARQYEQQLIQRIGLSPANYKLADGSGLSLYNYVSAELMMHLLRYAWRNKKVANHLMPALPVAAVDGTLKSRMAGDYTRGNVRAKTGTLTGISSLAGYCTAAGSRNLCFVILNQGVLRNSDAKAFQDRICQALCTPGNVSLTPPPAAVVKTNRTIQVSKRPKVTTTKKKNKKRKK